MSRAPYRAPDAPPPPPPCRCDACPGWSRRARAYCAACRARCLFVGSDGKRYRYRRAIRLVKHLTPEQRAATVQAGASLLKLLGRGMSAVGEAVARITGPPPPPPPAAPALGPQTPAETRARSLALLDAAMADIARGGTPPKP